MPRSARIAPKECIYHLLTRGNNRKGIFKNENDYTRYIEIIKKYKFKYKFKLYHYVLMRNHVHLVLELIAKGGNLAEIMKGINLSYAQYFKSRYKHIGHFWQDRYKSIIISSDEYLLACGSYVELNPLRSKIAEHPKDYKWSSFNAYAYGKGNTIVMDEHPSYKLLSENEKERMKKYRRYVKGMINKKNALKGEMEGRLIYGSENFIEKMNMTYRIEAKKKPKGRPKKNEKGAALIHY
jgi:putative transposase